jgi:tetratricopeptide (TPR) repeat protein
MYFRSAFLPLFFLLVVFQSPQDPVRQHYEAAEAQRRAGNLAAAETEYKVILAEGCGRLGKIYLAEKDYKEAVTALEAAALYRPDSEELLVNLAIAYFNGDQYEKALEPLRKVLDRNQQSTGAHHMAGKSYFMLGEFTKATSELEAALKLAPNDYDVAYTLGLAFLKQRRFAPAKQIYDRMLEQLGDRPQLRIVFGRAYRETDFLPEAIEEFNRAVALDPKFPRTHYYLGLTYLLKDGAARLNDAAEEFKIELIEHPDEFFANYYLGIVYLMQRKLPLAISLLEKASRIQPNNPDPYFHLGQAYQETRKHDQAIEALKKAITLNPYLGHNDYQVTTAHYRLGQSMVKVGRTEEGEKELQIASDLKSKAKKRDEEKVDLFLSEANIHEQNSKFPELHLVEGVIAESNAPDEKTRAELKASEAYYAKVVASAHNNIGLLRAQQQDFRVAVEQFAMAAKWNPQLEELNYNWGLACFKAELYKEAIPPLEDELKVQPANISAKQLLGLSYFMVDNYPRASDLLSAVIASKPSEAALYYPLAVSFVKQGRKDDAERVIQQMIALGGNSPPVHILLGQAYYEWGETANALEELKTALKLDSKTLLAHYYSGQISLKMGRFDEAAQEFESELALNPNDVRAKYHLGFVLLASQKTDRGMKLMREVIQLKPDYAEAHYELGKALLQQGDIKRAVQSLEIASKLKPDESYVHYQLGRAYLAAGRKAEGDSQLEISKQLKEKERSQTNP